MEKKIYILNSNNNLNINPNINSDLRNIFLKHNHRKSYENYNRGFYSEIDIQRLLNNVGIKDISNDIVKLLQTKLFEYNILLNKLFACNYDSDLDEICKGYGMDDELLKMVKLEINKLSSKYFELIGYIRGPRTLSMHGGWPLTPKNSSTLTGIVDFIQFIIDIIGFIPGIGDVADIINVIISTVRGNFFWQGFGSMIAIVPIIGSFIGMPIKYISKYNKYKKSLKIASYAKQQQNQRRKKRVRKN